MRLVKQNTDFQHFSVGSTSHLQNPLLQTIRALVSIIICTTPNTVQKIADYIIQSQQQKIIKLMHYLSQKYSKNNPNISKV
jgi:hypothetical protein